jgi:6,7-dimethyl-8-ribityllumazine synthase
MPSSFEGEHSADGFRFGVIASRFNEEIVEGLLAGAIDCLTRHGTNEITVFRVPGAFEIPTLTRMLIGRGGFDAIVTLGCLLRGQTPHFDFISAQVTSELSRISVDTCFPVAFGVITCNTLEQAVSRSSKGSGNKGWEAALAAIEMASLWRQIRTEDRRV